VIVPRLYDGRLFETPALWAMAMIFLLAAALAFGWSLSHAASDAALQDTYYVVVHYRYALCMSAMFCLFAGFYALFPRVTGYRYNALLANLQVLLTTAGVGTALATPFVFLTLYAMPRRFADYPETFAQANRISAAGALAAGLGMLMFFAVLIEALWRRRPAGA
jgi:cytochrome c oxidase subunit 1